jgi:hypothetical protein
MRALFQFAFSFVIKNYMDDDQQQINMVNSFMSFVRWKECYLLITEDILE